MSIIQKPRFTLKNVLRFMFAFSMQRREREIETFSSKRTGTVIRTADLVSWSFRLLCLNFRDVECKPESEPY
jgi:hypothetical protein